MKNIDATASLAASRTACCLAQWSAVFFSVTRSSWTHHFGLRSKCLPLLLLGSSGIRMAISPYPITSRIWAKVSGSSLISLQSLECSTGLIRTRNNVSNREMGEKILWKEKAISSWKWEQSPWPLQSVFNQDDAPIGLMSFQFLDRCDLSRIKSTPDSGRSHRS